VRDAVLRDSKAIKVYIRRTGSPEVCRTKVVNFRLVKTARKVIASSGTAAELLLASN